MSHADGESLGAAQPDGATRIASGLYEDPGRLGVQVISTYDAWNRLTAEALNGRVSRAAERGDDSIQVFEEGLVQLIQASTPESPQAEYLIMLDDASFGETVCARMHHHLGQRELSMFTGESTEVVIAGLSRPDLSGRGGLAAGRPLRSFEDEAVIRVEDGPEVVQTRYGLVVPADSHVQISIPPGVAHSFNAFGDNGAILSRHPDEATELEITGRGSDMVGQTTFVEVRHGTSSNCPTTP